MSDNLPSGYVEPPDHIDVMDERELRLEFRGVLTKLSVAREAIAALRAELDASQKALRAFVDAAKSWHEMHHPIGAAAVQCDRLCECIPAGEEALNLAENERLLSADEGFQEFVRLQSEPLICEQHGWRGGACVFCSRDALAERVKGCEVLLREVEFFLRGHPGEASVIRAKIKSALTGEPS